MKKNITVLGMHRSGTSLVANALASAGMYCGETPELMAAREDNPLGFFERIDVVQLNDELLEASGGNWFTPVLPGEPFADSLTGRRDAILTTLSASGPWLIKDPRMLLTWPFWCDSLQHTLKIYVYREPGPVAHSLRTRNQFPLEYGFALWESYNRSILRALSGNTFVAISFEELSRNPVAGLASLFDQLSRLGLTINADAADGIFDAQQDHGRDLPRGTEELLSPSQLQLRTLCQQLCSQGIVSETFSVPEINEQLVQNLQDFASAFGALATARQVEEKLEVMTQQHDMIYAQYLSLQDSHKALGKAHRTSGEELKYLRREHEEHENLQALHSQLCAQHDDLKTEQKTLLVQLQALQLEFERSRDKADYLFHQLDLSYRKLNDFMSSFPGRLTSLVTTLYKLVTLRPRRNSALDDLVEDAQQHLDTYANSVMAGPDSRIQMLWRVIRYLLAHPVSSWQSFSLPRLKRALSVCLGAEQSDLAIWVGQRFPSAVNATEHHLQPQLDEDLDTLELVFPEDDKPRVSIVVPVYNEYRMTLYCLRSVLEHSSDVAYELILADDCSSDPTATIKERVKNIKVVRGKENRGFLSNCNAAAAEAVADNILFLNNDVAVTPGWLSTLLHTLDAHPDIGIVGPKLLFGDGQLQEAGGIIWDDASGWNFGRMDDPAKPEYNYLRDTDYVSGACLLVRSTLWQQLGGFDNRYVPAYYEDTDIAFEARAAGYRVVYQPAASIYHFEGMSHGTDLASGIKQHQVDNQQKFRDKWAAGLAEEHFENSQHLFLARDRSRQRRCVLVIDHYVPSYDKDAGSRSTWMYLQLLVELGYNVKFLGANFFPHQPYTEELQQMGVEVLVGEHFARNIKRWLQDNANYIHTVYVHRPHVAEQFLPMLERMEPRPKLIYFGHDLHYLRKERELALTGDSKVAAEGREWRQREYALFQRFDQVYYPSQVEIDEIQGQQPDLTARAIPLYALDNHSKAETKTENRSGLLFVAGFNHPPNIDAMQWFVAEVLPKLRQSQPEVVLHIVGSNAPQSITSLAAERIVVHGYVSDDQLEILYRECAVACVPLRYGAGIKGKVIEAIQHGIPLVTTNVGAEGIPEAASVMQIADDADNFARACACAINGEAEVNRMLERYPAYLENNFSKARAARIIELDFGKATLESA